MLDATRAELVRGLEGHTGGLWARVCHVARVAGYPMAKAGARARRFRSDGAESLLAMVVALLYLADVRTGFLGKPRDGGGPWHRYTLSGLAQFAFGAQGEAELRRARRALDVMIGLGWAFPTKQVRRYRGGGEFVSEPGVRRLNLGAICKIAGTLWLLRRDRAYADATRGEGTARLNAKRADGAGSDGAAGSGGVLTAAVAASDTGPPG
ncbi:MAG TPA: hypothetical protein VFQ88_07220 [Nevskiaceae bacterium]|nr:hypothetical protein [Nevskiaceae bacterium]